MKKYAIITGDTNDADYVSQRFEIDDEFEAMLKRVAIALKIKKGSWNLNDYCNNPRPDVAYAGLLSEDDIDWFDECCITGIHSIDKIEILEVANEERIF